MSFNQSRAERSDSSQHRRLSRSGSSGQSRNFSGGSGKGGGTAHPPSPSSVNSSLSSNRSFTKSNVQGGQPRVNAASLYSDSNNASAVRTVQNGSHSQQPIHGAAGAPATGVTVKPTTDMSTQKSNRAVPKAPSSQAASVSSDSTAPATPAKALGDASKSFPLQFGSISPGFMNGMQIPARTNSAPPNLDEQQRDQARHASVRAVPTLPIPSVPKKQMPRKDGGASDQSSIGDAHQMSKAKRDVQVSPAPPVIQTQKASVHSIPGVSMQMPFHQPQVPVQFGGPNPQIQSQGMAGTSMPMPLPMPMHMPLPLPMGNAQLQYVQHHPMQPQGMIHQGQSLNFTSQMGSQLPPQISNVGNSIGTQFAQQQAGKFAGSRKVKITHPETHEELRLDKRADAHMDGGSSGPRSHLSVPQSQPVTSMPSYYSNSYNPRSLLFPAPSSVPLSGTQINPTSQAPRFSYPVSQGPPAVSFMNPASQHSSYSSKNNSPMHGIAESLSSAEHSRDVHNAMSSAPSASVMVKPTAGLHAEKIVDSSLAVSSPSVEKGETPRSFQQRGEASSIHLQRDSESWLEYSSHQPKPSLEAKSSALPVADKQSTAASPFSVDDTVSNSLSSAAPASFEESATDVLSSTENRGRETINRLESVKDQQKKQIKTGHSQPQYQVPGQSSSVFSFPPESSEQTNSFKGGTTETIASKTTNASLDTSGGNVDSTRDSLAGHGATSTGAPEFKTGSDRRGSTCESSEMFGASAIVDSLDTDHHARQNNSSLWDEPLKLQTMGAKEQGGAMLNEGPKEDKTSSKTSSESLSLKFSDVVNQTEQINSATKATNSHEVGSLEIAQKDLEEPLGHCKKDDTVADNLVIPNSPAPDAANANSSSLGINLSVSSNDDDNNHSTSDASFSRSDSLDGRQAVITHPVLSDERAAPVPTTSSVSESTLKCEGEGTEDVNAGLVSLPAAGSKDKPVPELSRSNSSVARGKKKKREILQKADAAGPTSDLYMAYKGPEEKKETVASSESRPSTSSTNSKQVLVDATQDDVISERSGQSKVEPDDWEDAADISTPTLETVDDENQVHGGLNHHQDGNGIMAKKYSRDFLLKFSGQCNDLPEGFDTDRAEALMVSNINVSRELYPSSVRISDRPSGGSRSDRRGSGMGDDDKWSKLHGPLALGRDPRMDGFGVNFRPGQGGNYGVLRNPRVQTPPYAGGILSGPMQSPGSQGGIQRNTPDSDRWQRATAFQKGLMPYPQTPLQVMHKAERKYEVGKKASEEESKQRQLKAILNKLTPQNFEKLFEQVKAVNIDNTVALTGVISQIFDKALMEPTFCEMYAKFCYHLAGELPDFSEDNEKITFKRLLLNKCQEEFERGEKEQKEADRANEEGAVKQSEEEREEKRIRVRRRMLGNIRLIGELYKKRMLTERIMHECIKKLLGQYQNPQNPDEEDIEALCKLMSTIGEMIDQPRAKEHMDAYFDTMAQLSNNMKLSSRVRFMLKDAIDLRKNKWQQRRKVEGPKKIEEVHRDAAQERQVNAGRLARGPSINSSVRNRQPMDFGPRGSTMLSSPTPQMSSFRGLPTQLRGYGAQDARMDDRHSFESRILSVPLPQRPIVEDSITLGPQGGLARGMSIRGHPSVPNISVAEAPSPGDSRRTSTGLNGYSSVSDRTAYGSREGPMSRYMPDRFVSPSHDQSSTQDRNVNYANRDLSADHSVTSPTICSRGPASAQNVPSDKVWPEEHLRDMSIETIKEFYSAKDEKEVALCIKDLNAPSFHPTMISMWVTDSFERKDMERDLLAKLLIHLSKPRGGMLNQDHLIQGFESVLATLEDAVNDAPKAGEFLGRIFGKIVLENVIPFTQVGQLIYEGGEEQGHLVEIGLAAEVVGTILETIKSERGESAINEIRSSSSLKLEKFRPPDTKKPLRLDKFI